MSSYDDDKDRVIAAWNVKVSYENSLDSCVYTNTEGFFNRNFINPWHAIQAVAFGAWNYNDPYVFFDGFGNVVSFYYIDDDKSPICLPELADYIVDYEKYYLLNIDIDDMLEECGEK